MQEPLGNDRRVPNRFHEDITLLHSDGEAADKAERFLRRGERTFYDLGVVSIVRTPEAARRSRRRLDILRPLVDGKPGCRIEQVHRPKDAGPFSLVFAHREDDGHSDNMARIEWADDGEAVRIRGIEVFGEWDVDAQAALRRLAA